MPNMISTSASIAVGQSTTTAIELNANSILGITTASNVTGSAITFLVSVDGTNYFSLYDDTSTEVALILSASATRAYNLPINTFYPWNHVKIREGTSASPVNQQTNNIIFNISTARL